MTMAQGNKSVGSHKSEYNVVGEEVANVLTSAREASAEMRAQARQYAESLIAGARAEIAEIHAAAEEEAARIVAIAQDEARRYTSESRRKVLRLVEAAQSRVTEAEKAVADAEHRRDLLLALEVEIEKSVNTVAEAVREKASNLRDRREASSATHTPDPVRDLDNLLVESTAVLLADDSDK